MPDVETAVEPTEIEVVGLDGGCEVDPRALDILFNVQQAMNVPKANKSGYGDFMYRNLEEIMEAAKTAAAPFRSLPLCTDEVEHVGDRYYIVGICKLMTPFGTIEARARAQEGSPKGGMDSGQFSGACSSYARKYAAQGLFAISADKDLDEIPKERTYPEGQFDAKCSFCGRIGHNLNSRTAKTFKCLSCGHIDWIPE